MTRRRPHGFFVRDDEGMVTGTHLAATVARDAVELLTGPFAHRIHTCAAEDCHLIYVDA